MNVKMSTEYGIVVCLSQHCEPVLSCRSRMVDIDIHVQFTVNYQDRSHKGAK